MNKLIIGLLFGALAFSCKREVATKPEKINVLEIIAAEFEYLSAKARFKFNHDKSKVSAIANFRIKKDSLIWISVSPALGIEVARILINSEHVHVLDKFSKKYYLYSFRELSEKYEFRVDYKMIESVLLGNLVNPYENQKIQRSERYFTYLSEKGVYLFENFIRASTMKLEKVKVTDGTSKNTILVNYTNFVMVENQIFPNKISAIIDYESEKPNTEIDISYNRLAIEKQPLDFPFSVPGKYERK